MLSWIKQLLCKHNWRIGSCMINGNEIILMSITIRCTKCKKTIFARKEE